MTFPLPEEDLVRSGIDDLRNHKLTYAALLERLVLLSSSN